MASAPTLPFVPVDEYLRTTYEPHCEYLDGVLWPKALPDRIHSRLQKLLLLLIAQQERKYGIEALPELHMRVTPTRWRVPDVCALVALPETPPLFTIEIVSQGEPWTELRAKVADHLAMNVSLVIVADPYNRTVTVATQSEPLREIKPPLLVDIPVPAAGTIQIDFDDLYRQL